MLSLHADDLVILSAPGYRKVVMFHDNARATFKVTKDDDEEDNIDAALNVIVKAIKAEVVAIEYESDASHLLTAVSRPCPCFLLCYHLEHFVG